MVRGQPDKLHLRVSALGKLRTAAREGTGLTGVEDQGLRVPTLRS